MTSREKPLLVTDKMRRQIAGAVAEIDLVQMAYLRQLTPAERVQRAASMIEAAERVGVYRLCHRQPGLNEEDALRIVRGGLLNHQRKQGPWRKRK